MDNINETRNDNGEIIWSRTDWEYVDDTYNHYINDKDSLITYIKNNNI